MLSYFIDIATRPEAIVGAGVLIVACAVWSLFNIGHRPKDLPPGPPTLPLIGNLHQLPPKDLYLQLREWAKEYGPIFSLKLGQSTTVVLADGHVIRDVVDGKGAAFADRPASWIREVFEDSRITSRGYDDLWKLERKLYHTQLNMNVVKKYIPYQEIETLQMCNELLDRPVDFPSILVRMTGSIAASMTYGVRLPKHDSETAKMLAVAEGFQKCAESTQMLDFYPSLRALLDIVPRKLNPLARAGVKAYAEEQAIFKGMYQRALDSKLPSFTRDIETAKEKSGLEGLLNDHSAAYIAGVSFEAGTDTTHNTLRSFIKAMALFPQAQLKAQQEIDALIGPNELPMGHHLTRLRYINALAKEVLRWIPTATGGALPHANTKDEFYKDYRIPKGSSVVVAVWSANNNEADFPEPREFRPERHSETGTFLEASNLREPSERGFWSFGSGRRMCPGMHVAQNTLLLSIARMIWAFNIAPAKDSDGKEIPIDRDAMVGHLAYGPAPFECWISPRSVARAELLRSEWAKSCDSLLDGEGQYGESVLG